LNTVRNKKYPERLFSIGGVFFIFGLYECSERLFELFTGFFIVNEANIDVEF
jgi:hypothetical protein